MCSTFIKICLTFLNSITFLKKKSITENLDICLVFYCFQVLNTSVTSSCIWSSKVYTYTHPENANYVQMIQWNLKKRGLVLWCLTPLSIIFQFYRFNGKGNRSTRRKPQTCHKSLTNIIRTCCTSRPEWDSNSQHQWW